MGSSTEKDFELESLEREIMDPKWDEQLSPVSFKEIPWKLQHEVTGDKFESDYPEADYLTLRQEQNLQWANVQFQTGVDHAKNNRTKEAIECYQVGLDLVPNHADLLVAYGALEANEGRYIKAIELLEQARKVDPGHPNAKDYLESVQETMEKKRPSALATKASMALRDATFEKQLTAGKRPEMPAEVSYDERYPMLPEIPNAEMKKSKKGKGKARKKSKSKKRRYESDSSSSSYERRKKSRKRDKKR